MKKEVEEYQTTRDLELENITGNLMIAQIQVDKLRSRLVGTLSRGSRYYYYSSSSSNKKVSAHAFKHNGKWYKVSIKVEQVSVDSNDA